MEGEAGELSSLEQHGLVQSPEPTSSFRALGTRSGDESVKTSESAAELRARSRMDASQKYFAEGDKLVASNQLNEALIMYTQAIALSLGLPRESELSMSDLVAVVDARIESSSKKFQTSVLLSSSTSLCRVSEILMTQSRFDDSLHVMGKALYVLKEKISEEDRDERVHMTAIRLHVNQAECHQIKGDYNNAKLALHEAQQTCETNIGKVHPIFADIATSQGLLAQAQGDFEHGTKLFFDALQVRQMCLGPNHPKVASAKINLSASLLLAGHNEEALKQAEEALQERRATYPPDHVIVAAAEYLKAKVLHSLSRNEEAAELMKHSLVVRKEKLGPRHPSVAQSLLGIGDITSAQGLPLEAKEAYEEALAIRREYYGGGGSSGDGEGGQHIEIAQALHALACNAEQRGDLENAELFFGKALAVRQGVALAMGKSSEQGHVDIAETKAKLASVYMQQGRFDEALEAATQAQEMLVRNLGETTTRGADCLQMQANICEAMGDVEEAARLRDKSEAVRSFVAAAPSPLAELEKSSLFANYEPDEEDLLITSPSPIAIEEEAKAEEKIGPSSALSVENKEEDMAVPVQQQPLAASLPFPSLIALENDEVIAAAKKTATSSTVIAIASVVAKTTAAAIVVEAASQEEQQQQQEGDGASAKEVAHDVAALAVTNNVVEAVAAVEDVQQETTEAPPPELPERTNEQEEGEAMADKKTQETPLVVQLPYEPVEVDVVEASASHDEPVRDIEIVAAEEVVEKEIEATAIQQQQEEAQEEAQQPEQEATAAAALMVAAADVPLVVKVTVDTFVAEEQNNQAAEVLLPPLVEDDATAYERIEQGDEEEAQAVVDLICKEQEEANPLLQVEVLGDKGPNTAAAIEVEVEKEEEAVLVQPQIEEEVDAVVDVQIVHVLEQEQQMEMAVHKAAEAVEAALATSGDDENKETNSSATPTRPLSPTNLSVLPSLSPSPVPSMVSTPIASMSRKDRLAAAQAQKLAEEEGKKAKRDKVMKEAASVGGVVGSFSFKQLLAGLRKSDFANTIINSPIKRSEIPLFSSSLPFPLQSSIALGASNITELAPVVKAVDAFSKSLPPPSPNASPNSHGRRFSAVVNASPPQQLQHSTSSSTSSSSSSYSLPPIKPFRGSPALLEQTREEDFEVNLKDFSDLQSSEFISSNHSWAKKPTSMQSGSGGSNATTKGLLLPSLHSPKSLPKTSRAAAIAAAAAAATDNYSQNKLKYRIIKTDEAALSTKCVEESRPFTSPLATSASSSLSSFLPAINKASSASSSIAPNGRDESKEPLVLFVTQDGDVELSRPKTTPSSSSPSKTAQSPLYSPNVSMSDFSFANEDASSGSKLSLQRTPLIIAFHRF